MTKNDQKDDRKFGVAVGPADSSVFYNIIKAIDGVNAEDCKIKAYPEYNFISVEVPSYDTAKILCQYEAEVIKVAMVDIKHFDENIKKVYALLPGLIKNKAVDFSQAPKKLNISFNFPPNISTLIFLTYMYSLNNNIQINRFDFSNCNIKGENGFTNFSNYFPKLKAVNLTGNPVVIKEPELNFGSAKIITDGVYDDFHYFNKKGQAEDNQYYEDYIVEQPQLIFQDLRANPVTIALDMYPSIQFNVNEFPTNGFICNFLKLMWDSIPDCSDYYFENAVFSIIVQYSPKTECFLSVDSNRANDSTNHFNGRANIIQFLQVLFPLGFKANPTSMNSSIIGNNLYSVIIHGVFAMDENRIFGFDRSFFIVFYNYNFLIFNDNLFIRDLPNIHE